MRCAKLAIIGLLAIAGCNKAPFPTARVRGTVTIDGQPMMRGRVMFAPVAKNGLNAGRPAFGSIQQDGSFTLSTYSEGDGAVVGDHWVTIVNELMATGESAQTVRQVSLGAGGAVNKSNFKRIAFPRETVAVVADQENDVDIKLTSEDIAKYGRRPDPDD